MFLYCADVTDVVFGLSHGMGAGVRTSCLKKVEIRTWWPSTSLASPSSRFHHISLPARLMLKRAGIAPPYCGAEYLTSTARLASVSSANAFFLAVSKSN